MNPIRPMAAFVESSPTLLRAAEGAASAGAKLLDEAVDLMSAAPKAANQSKFEPIYAREGNAIFPTSEKIDRVKMAKLISSSEVEAPVIKLFPKEPPQITLPVGISQVQKAEAMLTADYANMIHWDEAARAAASKIERPSNTIARQITTVEATPEQMEQQAITAASKYLHGISANPYSDFLAKYFGRYTHERLYWARSAVLIE